MAKESENYREGGGGSTRYIYKKVCVCSILSDSLTMLKIIADQLSAPNAPYTNC